ncbi:unnamed protein product [Cunninghamella echinulata]
MEVWVVHLEKESIFSNLNSNLSIKSAASAAQHRDSSKVVLEKEKEDAFHLPNPKRQRIQQQQEEQSISDMLSIKATNGVTSTNNSNETHIDPLGRIKKDEFLRLIMQSLQYLGYDNVAEQLQKMQALN